jgi:hypothetical protein
MSTEVPVSREEVLPSAHEMDSITLLGSFFSSASTLEANVPEGGGRVKGLVVHSPPYKSTKVKVYSPVGKLVLAAVSAMAISCTVEI